jgi:Lar family restriction alleviation protein
MPDATTPNLLPCPFCGGTELSIRTDLQSSIAYVVCSNCDAQGPPASFTEMLWEKEAAAAGWNQRSAWQPIETAPRDGTEIIVLSGKRVSAVISNGPDLACFSNEFEDEECLVWFPTHWQPLPARPTPLAVDP